MNITCSIPIDQPMDNPFSFDQESQDVPGIIKEYADALRKLNSATEQDFISIGNGLDDIHSRSKNISKIADSAVKLIADSNKAENAENLRVVFDSINAHLHNTQTKIDKSASFLKRMLDNGRSSKLPLEIFKKIVKHLRVLSISTKIENARLGTNDISFDILAEDIEKLSVMIGSKTVDILEGLLNLENMVHETMTKISSYKNIKQEITQTALSAITNDLKILSEKNTKSLDVVKKLELQSTEISSDISDVVSSLQFHDITRQQIEHVIDVLDDIRSAETGELNNGNSCMYALKEIGELQIRQLNNAKKEFTSAVEKVIKSLEALSKAAFKMSEETTKLTGVTGDNHSSFITELCNSLSNISSFFEKNRELDSWLSEAMRSVSETIEHLSVFVNDIEEIGLEIELIALNAQIKAAHAGEKGAALSVLAEAIRTLSYSARNQTSSITTLLKDISDIASELENKSRANDDNESAKTDDLTNIIEGMRILLESMHGNLQPLLTTLKDETSMLSDSISYLTSNVTAHTKTSEVINDVCNGLKELVSFAHNMMPNSFNNGDGDGTAYIKQLIEKYTMHSEREIHRSYFDKNTQDNLMLDGKAKVHAVSMQKQNNDENFGDNVELF